MPTRFPECMGWLLPPIRKGPDRKILGRQRHFRRSRRSFNRELEEPAANTLTRQRSKCVLNAKVALSN